MRSLLRSALPGTVRARRIRLGPLRGCRLVTSWRDYPAALLGYTERPLLRWLAAHVRPGETWLDVGAHYGYTALALSRLVGPQGRVFAFEPVPETAGCLAATRRHNGLPQLTVLPLGLSDAPRLSTVCAAVVRGMAEHGGPGGRSGARDRATILTAALDGVWAELCGGDRAIHGVKVDVQGMEAAVLAGMRGLLRELRPRLVVEFHAGVDRASALRVLDGLGYELPGVPIGSPATGGYADDRSYAFLPGPAAEVVAS
jgi:FkbM family methyltransferase